MNKLETPLWGDLEGVYEPREDSFFLLDTLEEELSQLVSIKPLLILEVGSGSGVIVTSLAKALGSSVSCLAVDINQRACAATSQTASLNNVKVDVVRGDLLSMLSKRNQVDVLIFNPPYVVTPDDEITGEIERSWAGGTDGTMVLNRLLPDLKDLISDKGVGYFVLIEENRPDLIAENLKESGIQSRIIARKKIPGEKLCILKFSKQLTV